jgi:hypothetical protein
MNSKYNMNQIYLNKYSFNKKISVNRGFIALIAVLLLNMGALAFSLVTLNNALEYADAVNQREFRIQSDMNAKACLDMVKLMLAKDYFLNGNVTLPLFDCTANVANNHIGNTKINVKAVFNGVSSQLSS